MSNGLLRVLRQGGALAAALIALACLHTVPADAAISPVAHTTATTGFGTASILTINKPAGTAAGDVMLMSITGDGGTALPTPAGWTALYSTASFTGYAATVYKIARAGEPASYTIGLGTTRKSVLAISAWRGVDNADPIDTYATDGWFSSTSAPAPSVTTARAN